MNEDGAPTVGRRAVLHGLLTGFGAVAVPGVAKADHPMHEHLSSASRLADAAQKAQAKGWKPDFLDEHQFAAFASISDRILPGASKLKCAEFIDQLLTVDSLENQRRFLSALGAFEGQARMQHGKRWVDLTEAEQAEILQVASSAQPSQPKPLPWTSGQPVTHTPPPDPPPSLTLRDQFDHLRGWVAGAYYSTEIGMKELGWTGNVFFEKLDGCSHPDSHAG